MSNSLEEIRLVIDSVPMLLSYVDRDLRYRFNNKAYADWFGYAPEEVVGRLVWEIIGEAAYQNILPQLKLALAGQRVSYDTAMSYRQGGARYVLTELIPDIAPGGEVRGFVAYVQDITARRQVEQKLQSVARQHAVLIDAQQEIAQSSRGRHRRRAPGPAIAARGKPVGTVRYGRAPALV